jgi:hypothetical protein
VSAFTQGADDFDGVLFGSQHSAIRRQPSGKATPTAGRLN